MTPAQRLRQLANVLNASTTLGLLLARLAGTETVGGPRGLVIAAGYRWRLPFAQDFTVGNVVIFRAGAEEDPGPLIHFEGGGVVRATWRQSLIRKSTQHGDTLGVF